MSEAACKDFSLFAPDHSMQRLNEPALWLRFPEPVTELTAVGNVAYAVCEETDAALKEKTFNTWHCPGNGIATPYDVRVRALTKRESALGTAAFRDWALQAPTTGDKGTGAFLAAADAYRKWCGIMQGWLNAYLRGETGKTLKEALDEAWDLSGGVRLYPLAILEISPETEKIESMQPWILELNH